MSGRYLVLAFLVWVASLGASSLVAGLTAAWSPGSQALLVEGLRLAGLAVVIWLLVLGRRAARRAA